MQLNRGFIFWGIALVTAGVVALAIQAAVIDGDVARQAWRLWPVLLVLIGLALIAARTPFGLAVLAIAGIVAGGMAGTLAAGLPDGISIGCGGDLGQTVSAEGEFTEGARVDLDISCGELRVSAADEEGWTLAAAHAAAAEPAVTTADGGLRVEADGAGLPFGDGRQSWDVGLPRDANLGLEVSANAASSVLALDGMTLQELSVEANAGEVVVDLAGASVAGLQIDANAGSVSLTVDDRSGVDGSVQMNAGSLRLCADVDAAISITIDEDNVTFAHDLDDADMQRTGDTWRAGTGTPAVSLDVRGNAANLMLNPDGGCS